jgi:hypothetical protein
VQEFLNDVLRRRVQLSPPTVGTLRKLLKLDPDFAL